ncbi:MAG: cysteine dioxygenase [Pyrinomonadaceae bacterium]
MSTISPQTKPSMPAVELKSTRRFSLASLTHALASLMSAPTQSDLDALLQKLELEPQELRPHIGFKPGTYTRHRIFRSDLCEMLVLCWLPGQRTAIHDHNGSYGAIRICEGEMAEEIFALSAERGLMHEVTYPRAAGEVTGTGVPDIHRIGNPDGSAQKMVTIHIYAPPLVRIHTYQPGSTQVGECWPDDPNNPANT